METLRPGTSSPFSSSCEYTSIRVFVLGIGLKKFLAQKSGLAFDGHFAIEQGIGTLNVIGPKMGDVQLPKKKKKGDVKSDVEQVTAPFGC